MKQLTATASLLATLAAAAPATQAQTSYGAQADGDWSDPATWTPGGGPPSAVDDANIGSTTPGGSAGTATVTLTGDTTADQVYVGRGSGTNGTLDLNGYVLFADDLLIGTSNGTGSLIHNGGRFELTDRLTVDDGNSFLFDAADTSADLTVTGGASVTTAATSNLSADVDVTGAGSTLNLADDLVLTDDLYVYGSDTEAAVVNADGHDMTADQVVVGRFGDLGALLDVGKLTADDLTVQDASSLLLTGGDDVVLSSLTLDDGGILDIEQAIGELAGLTLEGSSLSIDATSLLTLSFDSLLVEGLDWAFRWANPSGGGDRVASLMDYITGGLITWSAPWDVSVFDYGDGYTYIGYTDAQVPVPAGLTPLLLLVGAGWLGWRRRRGRHVGRGEVRAAEARNTATERRTDLLRRAGWTDRLVVARPRGSAPPWSPHPCP